MEVNIQTISWSSLYYTSKQLRDLCAQLNTECKCKKNRCNWTPYLLEQAVWSYHHRGSLPNNTTSEPSITDNNNTSTENKNNNNNNNKVSPKKNTNNTKKNRKEKKKPRNDSDTEGENSDTNTNNINKRRKKADW